jgi:exodeoxyribonuclease V alpha subunit
MIARNDYTLNVYNGDVGITVRGEEGNLRVAFPGPDNTPRLIAPVRLPEHETVFAMTVHKSQGSEFDTVILVLPDTDVPVLTRELLYTGITRARSRVVVIGSREMFMKGVGRKVERSSGLREGVWG